MPTNSSIETDLTEPPKARWPWQLKAGIALLVASGVCVSITLAILTDSYSSLAYSSTSPKPSELAEGIANAMRYSIPAAPLGIAGAVLLAFGLLRLPRAT